MLKGVKYMEFRAITGICVNAAITRVFNGSFPVPPNRRIKKRTSSNAYGIFLSGFTYIDFTKRFRQGLKGLYLGLIQATGRLTGASGNNQWPNGFDGPTSGIRSYMPLVKAASQIRA